MIAAIDPGMKGAIALLYDDNTLYIEDMPTLDKEVNAAAVSGIFVEFPPDHVYLEFVNGWNMGASSAFNFGQGMGVLKGVIATLEIPYTMVPPAQWKKHYHLSRDKDASRAAATRLFPKNAELFKRKKDDGRAEAALLALYAREKGATI